MGVGERAYYLTQVLEILPKEWSEEHSWNDLAVNTTKAKTTNKYSFSEKTKLQRLHLEIISGRVIPTNIETIV